MCVLAAGTPLNPHIHWGKHQSAWEEGCGQGTSSQQRAKRTPPHLHVLLCQRLDLAGRQHCVDVRLLLRAQQPAHHRPVVKPEGSRGHVHMLECKREKGEHEVCMSLEREVCTREMLVS